MERDLFGETLLPAAAPTAEQRALATTLPATVHVGTMSWSFPGWAGKVYGGNISERRLSADGLAAYASHPLLRAVEIDRSYYDPLNRDVFANYAAQVPEQFRFLVKAHEDCTAVRWAEHARYGSRRGQENPRFLNADYAIERVVAPIIEGLKEKAGVIVFQFPPQNVGDPHIFTDKLRRFLQQLPRGPAYAVELRNAELFTSDYCAMLGDVGAVHSHNIWTGMPPVKQQLLQVPPAARRPLVIRWLLRAGDRYEEAKQRYAPFENIQDEDVSSRETLADLIARATLHEIPVYVAINNKAEGCAPESVFRLVDRIVQKLSERGG